MSRLSNLVVLMMLSSCIYVTFSVKDDVAGLAKKVAVLKQDIRQEQEKIDIYKAEWAALTGAAHIDTLKKQLMPDLQIISVDQIHVAGRYQTQPKLAHSSQINAAF